MFFGDPCYVLSMTRSSWSLLALALVVWPGAAPAPASAQEPKSFWEEHKLFSYIENSATFNLTGSGRGGVNELRVYDDHEGYTFNVAEWSLKKDPSERYPFGYSLVLTVGIDSQKNHSIGIFRDEDDAFPFRNTAKFDLQEAYVSGLVALGSGLSVKGGKFVSLLGYEVVESPNNLNFSRGYLFSLATPLAHTGGLLSYTLTEWLSVAAGAVLGWDDAKNVNASLNWIAGPELIDDDDHERYVLDWILSYTGFKRWTLALNVDYGREDKDAFITSLRTRRNTDATWWGWAAYAAYDWTDKLRTSLRQEFFRDAHGARTGFGAALDLWSTTATIQYKIWKGLVGRLEYRHDAADERAFQVRYSRPDRTADGLLPRSRSLDTISISVYYLFF